MKVGQKLYKKDIIFPVEEFKIIKKEYEPIIESNLYLLNNNEYIRKKNNNIICLNKSGKGIDYYYKTREGAMNCYYKKRIESYNNDINQNNKRITWLKIEISINQRQYNEVGGYITKKKVERLEIGQKIYDYQDNEYQIESILNDKNGTYYNIEKDEYKFNVKIKEGLIFFNKDKEELYGYEEYPFPDYEFKTTRINARFYSLIIKIDELEKEIKRLEGFNKESKLKINKFKNKIK